MAAGVSTPISPTLASAWVLDARVMRLVDEVGRVRPVALGKTLLRRPGLIPYLNRLGTNSKFAVEQLGIVVRTIVDSLLSRPVPGPEDRAEDGPALPGSGR